MIIAGVLQRDKNIRNIVTGWYICDRFHRLFMIFHKKRSDKARSVAVFFMFLREADFSRVGFLVSALARLARCYLREEYPGCRATR
jgi:hypothetical protein